MKKLFKFISPIILPILFIITWHLLSILVDNRIILPGVDMVIDILLKPTQDVLKIGSLISNTWISILRVSIGYLIAVFIAVPLGMLLGYYKSLERFIMPFLGFFRPIAPLAWVPLVLAWFGVKSLATLFNISGGILYTTLNNIKLSMIFIIFIGAFFPILTNTIYGVKSVKRTLIDSALTLGANQFDIFFKILLPAALPSIVTGLRVGLGVGWMCLVSAEMLPGSIAGIGYLITHAYTMARTDIVIAGMICIGLVGGIFDGIFQFIESKFLSWQRLDK